MFTNPLFPGDYPDPSIVRVGGDYYCTHSSFEWAPGLLVWHSRDLRRWRPLANALPAYDGEIWAPEITRHEDRFFIYYKTLAGRVRVVTASDPAGPWTAPQEVGVGWIDPGHLAARDGRRYLFLSDGWMTELSPDGLRAVGEPRQVLHPWPMHDRWSNGGVCFEGPKLIYRDGFYHLFAAQGGTSGPATSHMVLHARAVHPDGPWEWSPLNPVVHTASREETWWSVGHGTVFDAVDGSWWMLVHGYRKNFHTLGRQTLLLPVRWTADGWLRAAAPADAELPGPAAELTLSPGGEHGPVPGDSLLWRSWRGRAERTLHPDGAWTLRASGTTLGDTAPLTLVPGHRAYTFEVTLERPAPGLTAGLCLWYSPEAHWGLQISEAGLCRTKRMPWAPSPRPLPPYSKLRLRVVNDHHEVRPWISLDDGPWEPAGNTDELSGYHQNVFHGFLSLRVGVFAFGEGEARFRDAAYLIGVPFA